MTPLETIRNIQEADCVILSQENILIEREEKHYLCPADQLLYRWQNQFRIGPDVLLGRFWEMLKEIPSVHREVIEEMVSVNLRPFLLEASQPVVVDTTRDESDPILYTEMRKNYLLYDTLKDAQMETSVGVTGVSKNESSWAIDYWPLYESKRLPLRLAEKAFFVQLTHPTVRLPLVMDLTLGEAVTGFLNDFCFYGDPQNRDQALTRVTKLAEQAREEGAFDVDDEGQEWPEINEGDEHC